MLSYIATYCGLILVSMSFCVYSQECRYSISSACSNCLPNRMCRGLCNSCHTQPDLTLNMTACLRCKDLFCSNCERYWHDSFSGDCGTCRRSFCSTINDQCKNGNFTTIYTEPPRVTKLSEIATSGFTDDKHGLDSTTKQFVEPRNTDKGEVTYEERTTTPNTAGPLHFTTFIKISSSKFTEDEYKTTKNKTTPVTAGKMGQQNEGGESLVKAAVGSVVSVFIIIAIAIIILYFIKKKAKHGSSKPQSASHEMRNSIYMTNAST
ncbi:uncharacterized protein LOC117104204 [Anneissia japonica]|uniref:uncharacterized protein LOC117104204 n=1 Tax=Anneissia japonica TaxID=1529436 RepID=UPI001425AC98|nr:uncharacterized protein LOC117104204 [Anneissia japonica]